MKKKFSQHKKDECLPVVNSTNYLSFMIDKDDDAPIFNNYKCKHCGAIVERESEKKWIRSWCDTTGKDVHLILCVGENIKNLNTDAE